MKGEIRCRGDFVEITEGAHRFLAHRSRVLLAIDPDDNCVVISFDTLVRPIIARPDNGVLVRDLFTALAEEIVGGKR